MDIRKNVRLSFKRVKNDFNEVKKLLSEWFYHFNNKQIKMEARLEELERRLERLEANKMQGMVYDKVSY